MRWLQTRMDSILQHKQGGATSNAQLERDQEIDPFIKRSSLSRTPPKARKFSLPGLEETLTESIKRDNKRKRIEGTTETNILDTTISDTIINNLQAIHKQAKILEKVIKETYKCKKEFTEIGSRILFLTEQMQSHSVKEWLERAARDAHDANELRDENQRLSTENDILKLRSLNESKEKSEYCEECRTIRESVEKRKILLYPKNFENFQKITEEEWENIIRPKIDTKTGNIWEIDTDYNIVLPCNDKFESANRYVRRNIENFGGKEGLRRQGKKAGGVAMMNQSLGFPDKQGNLNSKNRWIYYPIVSSDSADGFEDRLAFEALQEIKTHMTANKRTKIAIPNLGGIEGIILSRILEFLFEDTDIQAVTLSAPKTQTFAGVARSITPDETKTARPRTTKDDALLIKAGNQTYAELLKQLKGKINPSEIGVEVGAIKKTKSGDLLVTVKNGSDKMEALKKEIYERTPTVSAAKLIRKKVLHIKDLDAVTSEKEVNDAIVKVTSLPPQQIETRALRPTYDGKQNVTVILPEAEADKLLQVRSLKVGWTSCRIIERKKEIKCFRWWEYGHTKESCKGPDREKLCLKCGKEDHKAIQCRNEPFCILCKIAGHQTASANCTYKKDSKKV